MTTEPSENTPGRLWRSFLVLLAITAVGAGTPTASPPANERRRALQGADGGEKAAAVRNLDKPVTVVGPEGRSGEPSSEAAAVGSCTGIVFPDGSCLSTATAAGSQGPPGLPGPQGPPGSAVITEAICEPASQCGTVCAGPVVASVSGNDAPLGCVVTGHNGSCNISGPGTQCCVCVLP